MKCMYLYTNIFRFFDLQSVARGKFWALGVPRNWSTWLRRSRQTAVASSTASGKKIAQLSYAKFTDLKTHFPQTSSPKMQSLSDYLCKRLQFATLRTITNLGRKTKKTWGQDLLWADFSLVFAAHVVFQVITSSHAFVNWGVHCRTAAGHWNNQMDFAPMTTRDGTATSCHLICSLELRLHISSLKSMHWTSAFQRQSYFARREKNKSTCSCPQERGVSAMPFHAGLCKNKKRAAFEAFIGMLCLVWFLLRNAIYCLIAPVLILTSFRIYS